MPQANQESVQKQALVNKYRPIGIPALKAASNPCTKNKNQEGKTPCKNAGLPKFAEIS
jgi:hypothetical protein